MNQKQINILLAAVDVFSRYGFKKTTMGDIADHVGISRQTLYASYANKEEVMAAAMLFLTEKTLVEVREIWQTQSTLSEKVDAFFEHTILKYFRAVQSMPDSEDLLSGPDGFGKDALKHVDQLKTELLADLFAPYETPLAKLDTNPKDFADFVLKSASGFKYSAESEEQLLKLLGSLKQSMMLMLAEK
jgi:AcrR family transcriptional regulator